MINHKISNDSENKKILATDKEIFGHKKIKILLVDDSAFIRKALCSYLELQSDFEIVASVDNALAALEQSKKLNPDIVLMDLEMPGVDGLEATQAIARHFPNIKVIVLSIHDEQEYIDRVLEVGAKGYLLKTISMEELAYSIRFAEKGYLQFSPGVLEKLNHRQAYPLSNNSPGKSQGIEALGNSISHLTNRESGGSLSLNNQNTSELYHALDSVDSDSLMPSLSPWTKIGAIFLVGAVATAVGLANVIKYKVTVKAPSIVRPIGELRIVQAAMEGTITSIEVKENQQVQKGDVIALLSDYRLLTQQNQLEQNIDRSQQQLGQIDAQLKNLISRINSEELLIQRNIASAQANLNQELRQYQNLQATTEAELQEANAALVLAEEELKRYQQLAESGVVSTLQISEKKQAYKVALARIRRTKALIDPNRSGVDIAKEQITQEKLRGESAIAVLNQERESLIDNQIVIQNQLNSDRVELKQLEQELKKIQIKAPANGRIHQLRLRNPGQVVGVGDTIASIAPQNVPLSIKARVNAGDISKVELCSQTEVNQCQSGKVLMRFSAYPYPDYGVLTGAVREISADIVTPETAGGSAVASSYYEVTIEPERDYFLKNEQKYPIQAGMDATAQIISKEETLINFILRKARLIVN